MQKWGHDRILSDVVWVIRRYRPDVIILGFSGTPRDGHGQHQTSAILGKEAFDGGGGSEDVPGAAAVRTAVAGQAVGAGGGLRRGSGGSGRGRGGRGGRGGAAAGQPARRQPPAADAETQAPRPEADTGSFNPILGYSYEELAVLSRSMHHSQGTGAMRRPGPAASRRSRSPAARLRRSDLFDGIDTTWNRLPGGARGERDSGRGDPRRSNPRIPRRRFRRW